ncbi:MAG: DUF4118 domain-containing protein, partial [Rubrivivax sp.]|nr:DUF4118 domain-containing protein [Rubrivivax sp.]
MIAVLDDRIDLGNQALILVLASAVSALWWGPWASLATSAAAVLAFNFFFVPPRLTLSVGIQQHVVLLFTMLSVGWIVALLMARLRRAAVDAGQHALRSDQLRRLGEALREVEDPATQAPLLCEALASLSGRDAALLLADPSAPRIADPPTRVVLGTTTVAEKERLERCARQGRAPDHDDAATGAEAAWALPLRGRDASHGAALMRLAPIAPATPALRRHAQALCDQLGA